MKGIVCDECNADFTILEASQLNEIVVVLYRRLENNRLDCNCHLLATVNDFIQKRSAQVVATCFKPRSKRGAILSILKESDFNCGWYSVLHSLPLLLHSIFVSCFITYFLLSLLYSLLIA